MIEAMVAWLFGAFMLCCVTGVATVKYGRIQRILWPLVTLIACAILLLSIIATSPFWVRHG